MPIEEKALKYWIDNFYGYGSWHARFWFISYEESGGDLPEEVDERINYFLKINPAGSGSLFDIREMYKQVNVSLKGKKANSFNNLYQYRFDRNAIQNNLWKNLIAFTHGYLGIKLPDLLAYQKKHFLSSSKKMDALIPLYPLPSPHNHAWYYSWLDLPGLGYIRDRVQYEQNVFQRRIQHILLSITKYKPEVVLMFGMNNINSLKNSVQEFFPNAKFKMIKAVKGQIPQLHRADLGGTILLITTQIPTLRHNRIETGYDWEALGKKMRNF